MISLLNISFEEVSNPNSISVIAIMANEQSDTAGYGYNPIDIYLPDANFIFSDVFIAKDYLAPTTSGSVRNFDNELVSGTKLLNEFHIASIDTYVLDTYLHTTSVVQVDSLLSRGGWGRSEI